jgi:hypothetical protein
MDQFCRRHGYSGRTDPAVLIERLRPCAASQPVPNTDPAVSQ